MNRIRVALVLFGIAVSALVFHAQAPTPQSAYTFTEIVPGIYSAIGTGTMNVRSARAICW